MASQHGLLPASKEVVLEIQLNKLIHDFLFSGVGDGNTGSQCIVNAEGRDASCDAEKRSWSADGKSWKVDNPSSFCQKNAHITENASSLVNSKGAKRALNMEPGGVEERSPHTWLSNVLDECGDMPLDHNNRRCPASLPSTEEVKLDIPEETSNLDDVNAAKHTNKVKIFRLSKSHSVAGSVFCFSMRRHGENKEKESKGGATGGSIKLTRIGSLPCHSKLHSEADKGLKHTCKKPPRPPRSHSEKGPHSLLSRHASGDTILVLHGTSRRSRLERRKGHAGSLRSNASIWALIFTLLFALAMLGEGFWSVNSSRIANDSFNTTTLNSNMKPTAGMSTTERTHGSRIYVSSQLEKEMQMREFWMSKGLDPT